LIAIDLELILNRLGHEVVGIADTRDEAIRVAEVTRPDFAFVDVKLRDGFTGIDAARRLRTEFGLYCAFVTGNAEQISDNADIVVSKPFTQATIAQALPFSAV
jgi:two-component system, response regulator PdtaR